MSIKFGPAGIGSVKNVDETFEYYHEQGIRAAEAAFTYGVYIKKINDAVKVGKYSKKYNIDLSIHAPYWINLNSAEKIKIKQSKQRILQCCKIGHYLNAHTVVFHPGYYGKFEKQETYENIKKQIIEMQQEIKKNKWKIKLAPETTGKINVFGSVDEINNLVKDTNCFFCIDFAHIRARERKINYKEIFNKSEFKKSKNLHLHFSGIEYGEKGEKRHISTKQNELKELLKNVPNNRKITIINESPDPVKDTIISLNFYKQDK